MLTCPHASHTVRSIPEFWTVTTDSCVHPARTRLPLLVNNLLPPMAYLFFAPDPQFWSK